MIERIIFDILIFCNLICWIVNFRTAKRVETQRLKNIKDCEIILKHCQDNVESSKQNEVHAKKNQAMARKLCEIERQMIGLKLGQEN